MITVGRAGWLTASLMAVALTGCATTHGGLNSSADRLDRNAQAFAQDAQEAPHGYSENTGYDLSRSYHALRDDVERSGDRDARHDLQPVTQAYLDVEDNVGGAQAPSRYSEEDEDRGPG